MTNKNQSRPTAGTMERHTKNIDQNNHTTPAADCQLLELIPYGPENAVTGRQLSRLLGVGGREVRRRIAQERAAGAVVLTDGAGGYFKPSDNGQHGRDEVTDWLARITAKGVSTLRAGDSARAWLSVLPGQQQIGGADDGQG